MSFAELIRTTTFRWSLAIAAALLLQSFVLSGLFFLMTAHHAIAEVDASLRADCRSIAGMGREAVAAVVERRVAGDVHRVDLAGLFDGAGRRIAGNIVALPPALVRVRGPDVIGLVRSEPYDPVPNASRSIACRTAGGDVAVFARDTDELDAISALIRRALVGVSLPAVVLAAGLGLLLGRRGQQRFRRVEAAIARVMAGDLRTRLPVRSSVDPFDRLSCAVNAMLDRLETAIAELRCLGDDLAHELRTPLTRLRARLDRACRDAAGRDDFGRAADRAVHDIDHALAIVSALLRIRSIEEAKRGAAFRTIELAGLLGDAAELYAPMAEERGIRLALDVPGPVEVTADRDLMMEALCNLIDNALKFAPSGSEVRCSLRAGAAPVVCVVDEGPGIARDERAAVLHRFHRGKVHGARSDAEGHGIGLSLVEAIVRLHGFAFEIDDAHPGCVARIVCGATRGGASSPRRPAVARRTSGT